MLTSLKSVKFMREFQRVPIDSVFRHSVHTTSKLLPYKRNMINIVSKSFQYYPCPSWFYVYDNSEEIIRRVAKVYCEYPKVVNNYKSQYGKILNIKNNEIIKGKVIISENTRYKTIDDDLFMFVNNEDTYSFIKMLNGYKLEEEESKENKINNYEDYMSIKYAERN
jgi:hypothetical protein